MKNLSNVKSELKYFIRRPNTVVYKFKKVGKHFIHTYCEGDLLKKTGITPESIINKNLNELMPDKESKQKELIYERAWKGENVNFEGYMNSVYYFAVLLPILVDGKVVEVVGTAFDITNEKQNERLVQEAEKLAMVGQLAAGVAHEIRNPLTSLVGFTRILKETETSNDKQHYLDIMLNELKRIQQIVSEFMLLAKPHEGFKIKRISVQELINQVITVLQPEISLHNIRINTEFPTQILADCDENQIKQVLINLLQNAIDASSSKKGSIIISLIDLDENVYVIQIRDFGQGISKERQQRLFEPFYTTKEKGTGLGLMVCRQIIELHNGSIHISSEENIGTTVNIQLPKHYQIPSV